jgi:hypothetical protein
MRLATEIFDFKPFLLDKLNDNSFSSSIMNKEHITHLVKIIGLLRGFINWQLID